MAPGYWGKPSSTIDWYVMIGIRPFVYQGPATWNDLSFDLRHKDSLSIFKGNTLSNLMMIIPPLVTAYILVKQHLENRLVACHLSLFCVGVGSWCFHMTLLYSMQLLDELPMIICSAFLVYALYEIESPPGKSNGPLIIGLSIYCVIVVVIYISSNIPIFFQMAYGLMVVSMVFSGARLMRRLPWCNKKLFLSGVAIYTVGFLLWNIDNSFCGSLLSLREVAGFLAPLFELHTWWHICAGLGTYIGIVFIAHTRCLVLGQKATIKYWLHCWPYLSVPRQQNGFNMMTANL